MEQLQPLVDRVNQFLETPLGQQVSKRPVAGAIAVLCTLFHLACLVSSDKAISVLAMSPSSTLMGGMLWTTVTSGLVETNSFKLLVLGGLSTFGAYRLEEEMGSWNLAKYLLLVQVISSIIGVLIFVAVYTSTLSDSLFFNDIYGLAGVSASLSVAWTKQRFLSTGTTADVEADIESSDETAPAPRSPQIERYVVLLCVIGYALLGMKLSLPDALMVVSSFVVSVWKLSDGGFSFRLFLPRMANLQAGSLSSPGASSVGAIAPLHSNDPSKERFRARGFKLLDKKLAELEAAPEVSLDGDPSTTAPAPTTT